MNFWYFRKTYPNAWTNKQKPLWLRVFFPAQSLSKKRDSLTCGQGAGGAVAQTPRLAMSTISSFPHFPKRPVDTLACIAKDSPLYGYVYITWYPWDKQSFALMMVCKGKWLWLCPGKIRWLATVYQHRWADQTSRYWHGGSFLLLVSWQLAFFWPAGSASKRKVLKK